MFWFRRSRAVKLLLKLVMLHKNHTFLQNHNTGDRNGVTCLLVVSFFDFTLSRHSSVFQSFLRSKNMFSAKNSNFQTHTWAPHLADVWHILAKRSCRLRNFHFSSFFFGGRRNQIIGFFHRRKAACTRHSQSSCFMSCSYFTWRFFGSQSFVEKSFFEQFKLNSYSSWSLCTCITRFWKNQLVVAKF